MITEPGRTALHFQPPQRTAPLGIRIAPLIDIVFLLNCFFMLATELIQSQRDPAVELPAMLSPDARTEAPAEIIVNLRPDGAVTVHGAEMALDILKEYLAAQSVHAEESGRPLRVVVRADRRQRFARFDEVLNVCRDAGLEQVVLRSRELDQGPE
jgi:biopolymer transport protein ExbD